VGSDECTPRALAKWIAGITVGIRPIVIRNDMPVVWRVARKRIVQVIGLGGVVLGFNYYSSAYLGVNPSLRLLLASPRRLRRRIRQSGEE
jgi:hypothetical protein